MYGLTICQPSQKRPFPRTLTVIQGAHEESWGFASRKPFAIAYSRFPAQVVLVAGKAIHAMHYHHIPLTHIGEEGVQLRALRVQAGCPVGKHLVQFHAFKLALWVLVGRADAHIADALPFHDASLPVLSG